MATKEQEGRCEAQGKGCCCFWEWLFHLDGVDFPQDHPERLLTEGRGNHLFSDVAFSIEKKSISKKLELGHWTHVSVLGWVAGRDTGVKCLFSFIVLRTLWLRVSSTV